MLIGKVPSHEVRVEQCMLSGYFVVPQLLSGSPEMIAEIVSAECSSGSDVGDRYQRENCSLVVEHMKCVNHSGEENNRKSDG